MKSFTDFLTELSKGTLKSYIKKASDNQALHTKKSEANRNEYGRTRAGMISAPKNEPFKNQVARQMSADNYDWAAKKHAKKAEKRKAGISKAVDKL